MPEITSFVSCLHAAKLRSYKYSRRPTNTRRFVTCVREDLSACSSSWLIVTTMLAPHASRPA